MPKPSSGERNSLFQKLCADKWLTICKRMQFYPYLKSYTKTNSKLTKYLNVREKTGKLLEENLGVNLHNIGFSKEFLDMTSKAQQQKKYRKIRIYQN